MEKLSYMLLVLPVSLLIVGIIFSFGDLNFEEKVESKPSPTFSVNYSNIEKVMSSNYLIRAIPSEGVISLIIYNFSNKNIEKMFILTKSSFLEGEIENPEITLRIPSFYLDKLNNKNFCTIIQEANSKGDLQFETSLSTTSLAWKYRALLKYKDCFGL